MFTKKMKKGTRMFVIFFLLSNYYLFYLFPMPHIVNQINSHNMKYGLAALSLFLFLWRIVKSFFKLKINKPLYLIIGLYMILLYNIVFSFYRYGICSAVMIGRAVYPFLVCLLFFPVYELFRIKGYMRKTIQYLTVLNLAACVLLIVQSVLYSRYQIVFMHIPLYEMSGEVGIRNGNIRITFFDTMILFSLFLSLDEVGNHTETRLHVWNVILSFSAIYFVSQTRSEILICLACLLVCIIKRNRKMQLKNIFIMIGLLFVMAAGISYAGRYVVEKFTSVPDTSINTRFDELEYYLTLLKDNPFIGYGIIDPQREDMDAYKEIVHGAMLRFSITDIGIIGQTARSGVLVLVWYFCFIKYMFRREHLKKHICMSVFILLSSINLVILDAGRIIMLPLIFALYEMDGFRYLENGLK